jgi:cyclophilin family peptidyl-prolyl cis-trans isomerase
MKYNRIIFVLFLVCSVHSLLYAHVKFSEAERTIIRLQDERRGVDTIIKYLASPDEKVAWRAAIALANIGDTTSRTALVKRLAKETRPLVIDGIAFALGVLGPDAMSSNGLIEKTSKGTKFFSEELCIALARTTPIGNIEDLNFILGTRLQPKDKIQYPHPEIVAVSSALMQMGLRKMINSGGIEMCKELESDNDRVVRWHCAYALARTEDSALLAKHLDIIKLYLGDLGSTESRMFAATALGRIHNEEGGKMLIDAARSETEWRVRVNIYNAIAKLPHFTSAIHEILKKAVLESTKDSLTSNHVARTALDVIDQMIAAGKVSSPDSIGLQEWLSEYDPNRELHDDQSFQIRSQCMIPLARLGTTGEKINMASGYLNYSDRNAYVNATKALGIMPDTLAFMRLFRRVMVANRPDDIPYALDGLHSFFELVKKDKDLHKEMEDHHFVNIYRHMIIRFPTLTDNPAVVSRTMEFVKDSFIVKDSLHAEAEEYLLTYLDKYAYPQYHDQLISVLSAIEWLKPKNDTFRIKIEGVIRKAAFEWGDQMVVDSAEAALTSMGVLYREPVVKLIRDPIDWNKIEHMPDTMLIQSKFDMIYIKLNTYESPLSALNMIKLAKINWFANNFIHRIVPNFVIQSGDNTGTGDGGPDYRIRTEIAPTRYDSAGVVGMASSGKDTEGSQWFITECPTPHLNTRYTIWGEVVKGGENIEKFQLNEKIDNMISYR